MGQYEDLTKYAGLIKNSEWLKTIEMLKNFEYDNKKRYIVHYQKGNQRKSNSFEFHAVQCDKGIVDSIEIFTFTRYGYNADGAIDKADRSYTEVLKNIDIIKVNIINNDSWEFSNLNQLL